MPRVKAEQLPYLVLVEFRLNSPLPGWSNDFVEPEGLSSASWQILGAVAIAGRSLTVPQIAAHMGMTRQGAQKQVNLRVHDGLMQSIPNPMHQRSPRYELTTQGSTVYAAIYECWVAHAIQTAAKVKGRDSEAATQIS